MRIKRLHAVAPMHPSNSWGARDDKLYYGKYGQGFDPVLMPESIDTSLATAGQFTPRSNSVPECDEGISLTSNSTVSVYSGMQKGLRNRPFLSTMGVTAGKTFIYVNGGLLSTDATIRLRQGAAANVSGRTDHTLTFCEILFETETHFVILNRDVPRGNLTSGSARLMRLEKTQNAESVQILSGYFDCVYLGKCRTSTPGDYRHCIAFVTDYITAQHAGTSEQYTTSTIAPPIGEGNAGIAANGGKLHILAIAENVVSAASYSWVLQNRPLGSGSLLGNSNEIRHKYKICFDESLIFRDEEGYISRFSYVGHIPELGDEDWAIRGANTTTARIEKLQQTLGICHVDFGLPSPVLPALNFSHQQLTLPEELTSLEWTFYGASNQSHMGTALLSGRVWRTASKLYCVLLDGTERYVRSHSSRKAPQTPVTVISADIDAYNNIVNTRFDFLPYRFGLDADFEIQLLSADKLRVWLPVTEMPRYDIACIDLSGQSPEYHVHRFDNTNTNYWISSLGTVGNDLLVAFGLNNEAPVRLLIGDQLNVTMSFDAGTYEYGSTATLTVTSTEDCVGTIQLLYGAHNGSDKIEVTLSADAPQTFQVRALGELSAHLIHVE